MNAKTLTKKVRVNGFEASDTHEGVTVSFKGKSDRIEQKHDRLMVEEAMSFIARASQIEVK